MQTEGYTLNTLEQLLLECEKWKCKKTKQTSKWERACMHNDLNIIKSNLCSLGSRRTSGLIYYRLKLFLLNEGIFGYLPLNLH